MQITRREFCERSGALVLMASALGTVAPLFDAAPAFAQVPATELAQPGPLGDMAIGDAKAPVTIVEYASMTCSHCAAFQEKTFPELKKRYIDTGKVRYILREFPLDPLAAAGFLLARCASNNDTTRYYAVVDTLFAQQKTWVVQKPIEPLKAIAKQFGVSEQAFNTCLADQKSLDGIEAVRRRGAETFKVESTPTFFINGKKISGNLSIDEMAKHIEGLKS